jgi:hypothetical protein
MKGVLRLTVGVLLATLVLPANAQWLDQPTDSAQCDQFGRDKAITDPLCRFYGTVGRVESAGERLGECEPPGPRAPRGVLRRSRPQGRLKAW